MAADERTLTLVSSDGEAFMVPEAAAVQSKTIKNMVEDGCSGGRIPLDVTSKVLAQLIVYLKNHTTTDQSDEQKKENDEAFVNVSMIELFDYINAANYLYIPQLTELVAQKIADAIKDKSPASVRNLFGIENDYTPEEEEQVRKEYEWAFDDMNDD